MIDILLQILLILAWVLLVLIISVLVILLLVLFWPFQYSFNWQNDETMILSAKVKWLLGLVSANFDYPQAKSIRIRLCGLVIFDSSAPKKKKNTSDNTE